MRVALARQNPKYSGKPDQAKGCIQHHACPHFTPGMPKGGPSGNGNDHATHRSAGKRMQGIAAAHNIRPKDRNTQQEKPGRHPEITKMQHDHDGFAPAMHTAPSHQTNGMASSGKQQHRTGNHAPRIKDYGNDAKRNACQTHHVKPPEHGRHGRADLFALHPVACKGRDDPPANQPDQQYDRQNRGLIQQDRIKGDNIKAGCDKQSVKQCDHGNDRQNPHIAVIAGGNQFPHTKGKQEDEINQRPGNRQSRVKSLAKSNRQPSDQPACG